MAKLRISCQAWNDLLDVKAYTLRRLAALTNHIEGQLVRVRLVYDGSSTTAGSFSAMSLALAMLTTSIGCERDPKPDTQAAASATLEGAASLDLGAVRASVVDGLELAASDPVIAEGLGLAARLEDPSLHAALERLLARVAADPELTRASDQLFARLQDSPAMRAALVDYAREKPELDAAALSEGFVSYANVRLTRPELVTLLEAKLRAQLRAANPELARAFVGEAGGGSAIAAGVVSRLEDPGFASKLRERLGRDPTAVQARLERRLADPARAGQLLIAMQRELASKTALAQIVDHERAAKLIASGLTRALADEQVRERCEQLFALALAPRFDEAAFARALDDLFGEPVVAREAAALLGALAREPVVRAHVQRLCAEVTEQPGFEQQLLAALD